MKTKDQAIATLRNRLGSCAPGYVYQRRNGTWDWCSLTSDIGKQIESQTQIERHFGRTTLPADRAVHLFDCRDRHIDTLTGVERV